MTRRKTVREFGQKRRGDYVRVLLDERRGRYEVVYDDPAGGKAKKVFPSGRDGKREAVAWAEAFCEERRRLAARGTAKSIPQTSVRALALAYFSSPAYADLRPSSKINYRGRWEKWELFVGADTTAESTTLHDVDQFITRATASGRAVNQIRQMLNVARIVYNWGQSRKLVAVNELALHKWKRPKDAVVNEPEEYTDGEFMKLLTVLSPQSPRYWRAWVALMLAGHHAQRANAVLHLRWEDVNFDAGAIVWPKQWQKNGEPLVQPLTWDGISALETARYWARVPTGREYTRMNKRQRETAALIAESPWVLPGHGKAAQKPYGYQAMWRALMDAEERAGVAHRPWRALHGFRKMAGGNVADRTGDARLAMEWLGDKDMKQARAYLKHRTERLQRAADVVGNGEKPR